MGNRDSVRRSFLSRLVQIASSGKREISFPPVKLLREEEDVNLGIFKLKYFMSWFFWISQYTLLPFSALDLTRQDIFPLSFKATHPSQKPAFNLSALPQSLFVFVENRPLPPVSPKKERRPTKKENPSFSNQPIHCCERRLVERLFPDLDRQGQISSPLVTLRHLAIKCGRNWFEIFWGGVKPRLLSRPNLQLQSLVFFFFFWAEQRSEGWGTYLRRWFGGGGEGNSIFASPPQIPICIRREERRRGKLSSPLALSSPTKKSVGKLLFPTPIIPPPFSSSHLRPKDQFLIWKVGKEVGS